MSDGTITKFPMWRQAVEDFLREFQYGDLISHEWLENHFGMPGVAGSNKLTADQFRERQFEWLANIDAFRAELLRDHQVLLQSVRGQGYRWVPPHEQTEVAVKEFEREAGRVFRNTGRKLRNLRLSELTDGQRKENMDALAKFAALRGMARKALR